MHRDGQHCLISSAAFRISKLFKLKNIPQPALSQTEQAFSVIVFFFLASLIFFEIYKW